MTLTATSPQDIDHLASLIRGIRTAMMTTVCKDGSMWEHSGTLKDAPAEVIPDLGDHRRVDLNGVWTSQDVGTSKTRNENPLNGSE